MNPPMPVNLQSENRNAAHTAKRVAEREGRLWWQCSDPDYHGKQIYIGTLTVEATADSAPLLHAVRLARQYVPGGTTVYLNPGEILGLIMSIKDGEWDDDTPRSVTTEKEEALYAAFTQGKVAALRLDLPTIYPAPPLLPEGNSSSA